MKPIHREDNPNKQNLMYIPYASCNHKLSETLTYKLERGQSEVSQIDKLDASTPSGKNPSNGVAIRTSEWEKSQQRSWTSEWGRPHQRSWVHNRVWVGKTHQWSRGPAKNL